jgi:hypothetical protein
MFGTAKFEKLLAEASQVLYGANRNTMGSGQLLPTPNVVDAGDVELFFRGVGAGLVLLEPDGRFNTRDRPTPKGHWALLSRSARGGWFNAEYLPQIAAYVEAILDLGYPHERVLFELPAKSLQLDLAILDDDGAVRVLGEAKRSTPALSALRRGVVERFGHETPTVESKRRGDEQRQLAWRLWTVSPELTWLIGPGHREAFRTELAPLRLISLPKLPPASELELGHRPPRQLAPPLLA